MVFLGRFDGILVKPFFEQSTIAPSLAHVHWFGHEAVTKTGPDRINIAARIQNRTDGILQPSFSMVEVENSLHFSL